MRKHKTIKFIDLKPYVGAVSPYILWLSIVRRSSQSLSPIKAVQDPSGLCWYSGFESFPSDILEPVSVSVDRRLPDTFLRDVWLEAASARGVRGDENLRHWYLQLQRELSPEVANVLFGKRGLTYANAAKLAGVQPQRLSRILRAAH